MHNTRKRFSLVILYVLINEGKTDPICGTMLTADFPCLGENTGDPIATAISLR